MPHHNFDVPQEIQDLGDIAKQVRNLEQRKEKLGPTGRFPEGRLAPHDEGELRYAVGTLGANVVIDFGAPVKSLGLPPASARELGGILIARADEIEGVTGKESKR